MDSTLYSVSDIDTVGGWNHAREGASGIRIRGAAFRVGAAMMHGAQLALVGVGVGVFIPIPIALVGVGVGVDIPIPIALVGVGVGVGARIMVAHIPGPIRCGFGVGGRVVPRTLAS